MKANYFLALALTLTGAAFAESKINCDATAEGTQPYKFQIVYDWSAPRPSMNLVFANASLGGSGKFKVVYQGFGAAGYDSTQAQSMLVALDGDEMIQILWERGHGFGFGTFGEGDMKLGQQMQPGGEFGKYATYHVSCQQ